MSAHTHYAPEVLAALFEAVEMDDVVDPVVSLPDPIPVSCDRGEMRRCLDLCIQFWREGADRAQLRELVAKLLLDGDLAPDARLRFKHIRARYKHLRFALTLYGERHRAPFLFHKTVVTMGQLQDAFRNGRRFAVLRYGVTLRLLLSVPMWAAVQREVDSIRLDGAEGFLRYRNAEMVRLRQWLDDTRLTAHRFHSMRKIVSRLVSYYDTARTLEPDDRFFRMSRFLSAINGLMGSMHDDLVEGAVAGKQDYHRDAFALPEDIRIRLRLLTDRYPLRGEGVPGVPGKGSGGGGRGRVVQPRGCDPLMRSSTRSPG